jgi:hypothetical protein
MTATTFSGRQRQTAALARGSATVKRLAQERMERCLLQSAITKTKEVISGRRDGLARPAFERMTWFVLQLVRGNPVNARIMARRFEISDKTAYRDLEFVRDRWGLPIDFIKSKYSYQLREGFVCPLCGEHKESVQTNLIA